MLDYRPKVFSEASKSHASKNIFIILLCFLAVFIVIILLESIIAHSRIQRHRTPHFRVLPYKW